MKVSWDDHLGEESCQYTVEVDDSRVHEDSSYTDYLWMRDELKPMYQIEFDLTDQQTQDMTFFEAYHNADYVVATKFELLPTVYPWNSSEFGILNGTQVPVLVNRFTDEVRKLWISREL
jgi:hypothetical protein